MSKKPKENVQKSKKKKKNVEERKPFVLAKNSLCGVSELRRRIDP